MKFSKDLLELRDKEAKLVKMKRYEEAEKVKMKADLLEEFERNKLEAEVSSSHNYWLSFTYLLIDASNSGEKGVEAKTHLATCAGCFTQAHSERQERVA